MNCIGGYANVECAGVRPSLGTGPMRCLGGPAVVKAEQMIVDLKHADVYLTGTRGAECHNEHESYRQGAHGPVNREVLQSIVIAERMHWTIRYSMIANGRERQRCQFSRDRERYCLFTSNNLERRPFLREALGFWALRRRPV